MRPFAAWFAGFQDSRDELGGVMWESIHNVEGDVFELLQVDGITFDAYGSEGLAPVGL